MNEFHIYPVGTNYTKEDYWMGDSVLYDNLHDNLFLEERAIGCEGLVFAPFPTNVHAILL